MNKKRVLLTSFLTILITLACTIFVGGPDYPQPPIPISAEAVLALQQQAQVALAAGAVSGEVTLQINEVQLTSYLAYKLLEDPSPLFVEPQVYLRNGQMSIYGKARRGYFYANIRIVLVVGTDEAGQPQLQLASADFGPLPLPKGLNKAITAVIEEAYTGALGPVATGFRLTSISIADGIMTVVGRIR